MALPTISAARPTRATAAWLVALVVLIGSAACLTLLQTAPTDLWLGGLAHVLLMVASIGIFAGLARARRRTAWLTLKRSESAFVIGISLLYSVRFIGFGLALLASTNSPPALAEQPWPTIRVSTNVILVAAVTLECLTLIDCRRPIELRPHGLLLRRPFTRYEVPWDAMTPIPPPNPNDRKSRKPISIGIDQPQLIESGRLAKRRPRTITLPAVAPRAELAALLGHYITHPPDRQAIGTADELQRLRNTGLA